MSHFYDLEKPGIIGVPDRIMRGNGVNLFKSHHKTRTRPENPGLRYPCRSPNFTDYCMKFGVLEAKKKIVCSQDY